VSNHDQGKPLFDRTQLRRQRRRAAGQFCDHDYIHSALSHMAHDRLEELDQDFANCLIHSRVPMTLPFKYTYAVHTAPDRYNHPPDVIFEEEVVPFSDNSFDLVVSLGLLQWVDDLPGLLQQIRQCLRPGGLFLGIMINDLPQIRRCLLEAESGNRDQIPMRLSPMLDVRDGGRLLQQAGFSAQVSDLDRIGASYPNPRKALSDIRGMGEGCALRDRHALGRDVLNDLERLLMEYHGDNDGRLQLDWQILTLTGWLK